MTFEHTATAMAPPPLRHASPLKSTRFLVIRPWHACCHGPARAMGDADITPEKEIRAMMTATDDERMRRISCEIVQEDIDKAREEGREEGFEKGLEAGREAGREEGFEEGLEKGLEEAREAREEMVRSLLGRLFARRVGRQPSTVEERALVDRTRELGAEQVEDALLGHEGEALVRWLLGSQKGNGKRSKSLAKKKR